jgi:hypothetical protein
MGDDGGFYEPGRQPVRDGTFRFAGVELKPEDDPQEVSAKALQKQAKRELWKNSIGSVIAGLIPILIELWLAKAGLYDLPSPYHFLRDGLPLFYIGWAMYWGIRDCVNAELMNQDRAANRFLDAALRIRWLRLLGVGDSIFLAFAFLIVYNLFGGGIYGFYIVMRQAMAAPAARNAPLG